MDPKKCSNISQMEEAFEVFFKKVRKTMKILVIDRVQNKTVKQGSLFHSIIKVL